MLLSILLNLGALLLKIVPKKYAKQRIKKVEKAVIIEKATIIFSSFKLPFRHTDSCYFEVM